MKNNNRIQIYQLLAIGFVLFFTVGCKKDETNPSNTVSDIDGNVYHTVTIGTQTWMVENLKTTKYNDGTAIPNVTDATTWSTLSTGAYCDYANTPSNGTTYGKLYNYYSVVDARKLCPTGWHVPTDAEWTTLENYLIANGFNYDGTTTGNNYAKALASAAGWNSCAGIGTVGNSDYPAKRNATGFTALPGGFINYTGTFYGIDIDSFWWTSTETGPQSAWSRSIFNDGTYVDRFGNHPMSFGFSVRCIMD
jgi:uncharacterized protein (TIGR02145 family)